MDQAVKKRPLIVRFFKYFLPWRGDRPGEVIRKIIMLIALVVFFVSAWYIFDYYWTREQEQQGYNDLAEQYVRDPNADADDGILSQFQSLYEINQDLVGYIEIENTNLAYPVVRSKDNKDYLNVDFYGRQSVYGVPFLDYRCRLDQNEQTDNLIIYGHHINGKRLFGQLVNYSSIDFYREHPMVQFDSLYWTGDWKIISVFVTNIYPEHDNGNVFEYQNYLEMDEERFNEYIDEVTKRSYISTTVDVEYGDQLLTLSTCSYEFDEARTVLVARKVRDGEDAGVDVSNAQKNNNAVYPAIMSK